jgi:hypothetical protein
MFRHILTLLFLIDSRIPQSDNKTSGAPGTSV